MMDIVSSTQSGDIILEPKDLTITNKEMNTTLKLGADPDDKRSKTLTVSNNL